MPKYALIIPVFNRPQEVEELLESLTSQTFEDFEVLIVEDGSTKRCRSVCDQYTERLNIRYFYKENTGQGFSRNFGAEQAASDFIIFFDSDVIVPPTYLEIIDKYLSENRLDAFGGGDSASSSFSGLQQAISYAMTSVFTTGGIRNRNKNFGGNYQLRSYNMGISKAAFSRVGGFAKTNMGEDMELSHRLDLLNFKKELIPNASVFHKRRGNFIGFFKQIYSFGQTRIQLKRDFGIPIKIVHFLPFLFTLFVFSLPISFCCYKPLYNLSFLILSVYFCLLFIDSLRISKSIWVAILSVPACFIQLFAYGLGFLVEGIGVKREL